MVSPSLHHVLHTTRSLCPFCLRVLEAEVVQEQGHVYMRKTCPADGPFEIYLWPSAEHYQWFTSFRFPAVPPATQVAVRAGCPSDCGLCLDHSRRPTLVEIEITRRCNLACPVCFTSAHDAVETTTLQEIEHTLQQIRQNVGVEVGVRLTGGEPTVRRDLADLVRSGRELGFTAMEVHTNGIALAHNLDLARSLRDAGLTGIYLQFDGLRDSVVRQLRGADLVETKQRAIRNCRDAGLQVVLAATVIAGINDQELGSLLDFALENSDVVRGLALQPGFTSGRFEVYPERRLTMGDVVNLLVAQSRDRLEVTDLWPSGCSHPLCSCEARRFPAPSERGLSILIRNTMDAWTMDLERLKECSMTVATPDGRLIPFCAYHLTNADGRRLYESFGKTSAGERG